MAAGRTGRTYMPGPFSWPVPEEGFCWVEAADRESRRLGRYLVAAEHLRRGPVEKVLEPAPAERLTEPMADRQLFLRFAELEPTEEGIASFASHYGALGTPRDGLGNLVKLGDGTLAEGT